jgi:hypothetical protein
MILKIGRNSSVPCKSDEVPAKNWVWEYVEKVGNVIVNSHETPMINTPDLCEVTEVMYYLNSNKNTDDKGDCHSTTLSGADVCYLMNDEGRTIERIR